MSEAGEKNFIVTPEEMNTPPISPRREPFPAEPISCGSAIAPSGTERFMALVEMLFVAGLPTDLILAFVLSVVLGGKDPAAFQHHPVWLFVYLIGSTVFVLGFVALFQKLHSGEPVLRLRFRPEQGWLREIMIGLILLPLLLGLTVAARLAFQALWPGAVPKINPLLNLLRTPRDFVLFFFSGILAGGLREEIQRAFILRRCAVFFWTPYLGLVVWSILFGLMHSSQGPDAIVVTAVLGAVFGLLYLFRRNIFTPFLCHCLFNTVVLVLTSIAK